MEGSNFINLIAGNTGKTIISVRNYQSKPWSGLFKQAEQIFGLTV